jgi:soluble lytic murein transglycosylase-like protein
MSEEPTINQVVPLSALKALTPHHIPASIISALVSVLVVLAGLFGAYTMIRNAQKDHMELVVALSQNNQEAILLKIVDEKTSLPMETKVLIARTLRNMVTVKQIPLFLACGIIHVETGGSWRTDLISTAGAVGLLQVMPATGKPYLRAERIDPTKKALMDPINSIICGISALADFHDMAVDLGLEKPEQFEVSLAMYNGGPRATKPTAYSKSVIEAAKLYKAMGL